MDEVLLRSLVDLRERTLQKNRIAFGNRISAIEQGRDNAEPEVYAQLVKWHDRFLDLETEATEDIGEIVKDVPIVDELINIKGIGSGLAAKIVSMIDISRANTVSALWRYAGYAVFDGEREKPVKGERLHYNKRLKSACYLVAVSFLRSNSPYRIFYDKAREHYTVTHPDWTKGHCHNAALRKMTKVFLSHLWVRWRELEGLPTRNLYVEEYGGHTHYDKPETYGWISRTS